jgi:hypothetical protein
MIRESNMFFFLSTYIISVDILRTAATLVEKKYSGSLSISLMLNLSSRKIHEKSFSPYRKKKIENVFLFLFGLSRR